MIAFIIGVVIGACAGFIICGLLMANREK